MTILADLPRTTAPPASAVLTGALAGLQAVAASVVLVLGPVVLGWLTGTGSGVDWSRAVRLGVAAWLASMNVAIDLPDGTFALTPLGLSVVPVAACWLSARRMAQALDPNGERIAAGFGRARPQAAPPRAIATFVVTFSVLVTVLAAVAGTPQARPVLWQAAVSGAVLSTLAAFAGSAAWETGRVLDGVRLVIWRAARRLRLPAGVRRLGRPAVVGLGVHLSVSAALLGLAVVGSLPAIWDVHSALDPGLVGGVLLVLLQLVLLPNAVVWAAAFLAGTGFAVGAGTSVTPAASDLGPLPALPLLAALPGPGGMPGWLWVGLAGPLVAGICLGVSYGRRAAGRHSPSSRVLGVARAVGDVVAAAAIAGAGMTVLAWLAGGAAGPGRLSTVGPAPLLVGAALAAELAVGGLLALAVRPLLSRVGRAPRSAAVEASSRWARSARSLAGTTTHRVHASGRAAVARVRRRS
jgi:hypothetical protein